jgi:hypothetical protein
MTDIFDGDPLIVLTENGAEMVINGGQPVMDQGFLNHNNFSWLTEAGHWSDDIEPNAARRPNGALMEIIKKNRPTTRQSLIDTERAAEADVKGDEYKTVQSTATNPTSNNININTEFTPPTSDPFKLRLERVGQNWKSQIENPQNKILNDPDI